MEKDDLLSKTLLRPSDASAFFGIPLHTIYFWYAVGNIDGINVNGRCLRIFTMSLQQFLASKQLDRGALPCETGRKPALHKVTSAWEPCLPISGQ